MVYILRNSDKSIHSFSARGDDTALLEGQYIEFSPLSFESYSKRLLLSVDGASGQNVIIEQGGACAVVDVHCPGESSVSLLINGEIEVLTLEDGRASLTLSADEPGIYIISPADQTKYCPAGEALLTVEVK